MRRRTLTVLATAAGTALLCFVPFAAANATNATNAAGHPTVRTVVRPVTSSGHPVHGYTVTRPEGVGPIDCSYPQASVAAVDGGIVACSPDAAYAVACWRSATHHVLCLDDARTAKLTGFRTSGKIADPRPLKVRGPLDLKLVNGVYCGLRAGGAGVSLRQHPTWGAFYYCTKGQAVWAKAGAVNFGVDRAHPVWTVQLANGNGKQDVHTVRVARAFLVGTQS